MKTETQEDHIRRIDDAKSEHAKRLSNIDFADQSALDMAANAIKALLLINGGAAVAMLGFIASAVGKDSLISLDISAIVAALIWFAGGVGAATLSSAFAYCVMYTLGRELSGVTFTLHHPFVVEKPSAKRWQIVGDTAHVLGAVTALGSLACFAIGVFEVAEVLVSTKVVPK